MLLLSLLLHDIGKAHRHDEGNHVHPSTEGVKVILGSLEIPEDQAEMVVFVIKSHLEMSKVILRRDFSDERVITQFADLVGSVENLRMLCLLTYADVKAVNNEVLTAWKEDLLWQLYIETYNRLTLGLADDRYEQQPSFESEIEAIVRLFRTARRLRISVNSWMVSKTLSEEHARESDCGTFPSVAQTFEAAHGNAPLKERERLRTPCHDCRPAISVFKDYGGADVLRHEYCAGPGVLKYTLHDL